MANNEKGLAKEKEEELKKLLVSSDFKEESYGKLSVQEMIILKNSAQTMKIKNVTQEKAQYFFEKREEFFEHLVLRRMQKMETIFCVFAKVTNLPYIYCDPESCNDQVWLFSEERYAQKLVMIERQNKRELVVVKLENKQFLSFFTGLYTMGVNAFVMDKGMNSVEIDLEKLVRKPDLSKLPEEKRPLQNPELLLTGVYFAQERNLPEEMRNMQVLRDLEEEMIVNLRRGKVMIPVQIPERAEKVEPKDMKIPFLKMKNGDVFQPVCIDPSEFQRFNRNQGFRAIVVDCERLKAMLGPQVKGIMLNPVTLKLAVPRARL